MYILLGLVCVVHVCGGCGVGDRKTTRLFPKEIKNCLTPDCLMAVSAMAVCSGNVVTELGKLLEGMKKRAVGCAMGIIFITRSVTLFLQVWSFGTILVHAV
jgi:hypothetical protein